MTKILNCPFCGFQPEMDDPDFLYPILTDRTLWGAHCPSPAGGCSASVLGESRDEALVHWNSRAAVSTPPIGEDAANGAIGERVREAVIAERICAQGERIEARYRAALAAEKVAAEPVAWMIRIGDSNVWSYTQLESDADFYGKQSGMKYEKRPLYAAPQQPAQSAEQDERAASPTSGMTLGERIAHVGGRTNAAGYIEFGSVQAVNALVEHVLRDARAASTQSTATQPAQTQVALTNEQIWQSLKGIADSHTHPDDVVEAGRALLAAQPADGGKS